MDDAEGGPLWGQHPRRPIDVGTLGLSDPLVAQLDAWEARYFEIVGKPAHDPPPVPPERIPEVRTQMTERLREGLALAP